MRAFEKEGEIRALGKEGGMLLICVIGSSSSSAAAAELGPSL